MMQKCNFRKIPQPDCGSYSLGRKQLALEPQPGVVASTNNVLDFSRASRLDVRGKSDKHFLRRTLVRYFLHFVRVVRLADHFEGLNLENVMR